MTENRKRLFNALYTHVEFRMVRPVDCKLFQSADLICTMELLAEKAESASFTKSEKEFFGSVCAFRKDYLRTLEKKCTAGRCAHMQFYRIEAEVDGMEELSGRKQKQDRGCVFQARTEAAYSASADRVMPVVSSLQDGRVVCGMLAKDPCDVEARAAASCSSTRRTPPRRGTPALSAMRLSIPLSRRWRTTGRTR